MATLASRLLTQSAPSSHKHKNITTHTTFCGSSGAFFTLKKKSEKKHQVFCLLLHPLSLAASNKLLLHCSLFYHLTFTIRILLAFFPHLRLLCRRCWACANPFNQRKLAVHTCDPAQAAVVKTFH